MKQMYFRITLIFLILVISSCGSDTTNSPSGYAAKLQPCESDNNEQCLEITLPCTESETYGKAGWYHHSCKNEVIQIPNGRPIYAFLVSGFDQNKNLDMFHFYNFAKCIFKRTEDHDKKAYIHHAWWNNLLSPYMQKPLHNDGSVPSMALGALAATPDYLGFLYDPNVEPGNAAFNVPTKAIPAEDYQFQKDAKKVLEAIRENNPDAAIILAGHSMGGDAVIRLADSMPDDFKIDMLAPIDPVGNRTCLPNKSMADPVQMAWHNTTCDGAYNFTRFQATHEDWYWWPYRISFKNNDINYLYHRWQNEAAFPFDWKCPLYTNVLGIHVRDFGCPLQLHMLSLPFDESNVPDAYLFRHNDPRKPGINQGSTNVQEAIQMNWKSGTDVFPDPLHFWNWGGLSDGHGEIVGFRALNPENMLQSYPLALATPDYWPSLQQERSFDDEINRAKVRNLRVSLLKHWENDPEYLDTNYWAPQKPPKSYCDARNFEYDSDYCTYCMVSGDLCEILRTKVDIPINSAPVANTGPDQVVECSGLNGASVTLDGSGSTDPDNDPLNFTWTGSFGTLSGAIISPQLPLGTHAIILTVDDGDKTDTDSVEVTVLDSTSPALSVSLSPKVLWPPNHKMANVTASIQIGDVCDDNPRVELVSILSNEPDDSIGDGDTSNDIQGTNFGIDDRTFSLRAERAGNGSGRIYTVTYEAIDASDNFASALTEVTVPHNYYPEDKGGD